MPTVYGLEILTHIRLIERVTRHVDETFFEHVGQWAQLNSDGSLSNVVAGSPALINKMVINSRRQSKYESHDSSLGRITTMESIGVRCVVPQACFAGTINLGDRLMVSVSVGDTGKLVSAEEYAVSGTYEVVARCEQISTTEGWMLFKTSSPSMVTII